MERLYKVVGIATATNAPIVKTTQPLLSRSYLVGESGEKKVSVTQGGCLNGKALGAHRGIQNPRGGYR